MMVCNEADTTVLSAPVKLGTVAFSCQSHNGLDVSTHITKPTQDLPK